MTDKAVEYVRLFDCPKCGSTFEDPNPGKKYTSGILCPVCPGVLKGVVHPRVLKVKITQEDWDTVIGFLNDIVSIRKQGLSEDCKVRYNSTVSLVSKIEEIERYLELHYGPRARTDSEEVAGGEQGSGDY